MYATPGEKREAHYKKKTSAVRDDSDLYEGGRATMGMGYEVGDIC